jgi:DNA-binding NtrC family response regulator
MLQTLNRTLRGQPYQVHTFDDPRRALEFLSRHHADIVISDIDMPEISGLELMRQIKAIQPEAARVIVSGVTSIDAAVRAINEGSVQRFLRKPFEPPELREVVAALVAVPAPLVVAPSHSSVERDAEGRYAIRAGSLARAPELGLEHLVRLWPVEALGD